MPVRLLTPADYRRMPWKNGGGETIEIARAPEGGGLDTFDWRFSMATVAQDGPFSIFPGIDRHLSVLTGAGIHLDFADGRTATLTRQSDPFGFRGDVAVTGRLIDGPITDLNLMYRRGSKQVGSHRILDPRGATFATGDSTLIIYAEEKCEVIFNRKIFIIEPGCTIYGRIETDVEVYSKSANLMIVRN